MSSATPSRSLPLSFTECSPTRVVIQLATQVIIPDFAIAYDSVPLQDFHPTYVSLGDGSLLAAPYMADLVQALLTLLVLSMVFALFLRNIAITGQYFFVRSRIIHDRRLFLGLFASQLLGAVGIVPSLVSYFHATDCTSVLRVERLVAFVSLSILIPGILGFKAYRCLADPLPVLILLCIFQLAATIILAFELVDMLGERRLSGSCQTRGMTRMMLASVCIQLAQIVFICLCFVFAIWKSRSSPIGRMSCSSISGPPSLSSPTSPRRGRLWDRSQEVKEKQTQSAPSDRRQPTSLVRKSLTFLHGPYTHPKPSLKYPVPGVPDSPLSPQQATPNSTPQRPPSIPSISRLNHILPRMELFHRVMRDELYFTTLICVACILALVFTLIGLNFKNNLSIQGWMAIQWAVVSVVVIKTFDRALTRRENDVAYTTMHSPALYRWDGAPKINPPSIGLRIARQRAAPDLDDPDNPFSDSRRLIRSSAASDITTGSSRGDYYQSDPATSLETPRFARNSDSILSSSPLADHFSVS